MNLEQEKSPNNFEQLSQNGREAFELIPNRAEIPVVAPSETTITEVSELTIEPTSAKVLKATLPNPTTQANGLGEKTLELVILTENKVNEDAGNANKIVDKFNEYKKAA